MGDVIVDDRDSDVEQEGKAFMQTSFEEEVKEEIKEEPVPEETWEIPHHLDRVQVITNWP